MRQLARKGYPWIGALLVSVACSDPEPQGSPSTDRDWEHLDGRLEQIRTERELPGLSVAVLHQGKPLLVRGYGSANLERDIAMTPETVLAIGSIEKTFIAAAVLRLAEQGKLDLDDEITDHLSELHTGGEHVTVRQMLQHVSGLADFGVAQAWRRRHTGSLPRGVQVARSASLIRAGRGFDPAAEVALFDGVPLAHDPGTRWSYSQPNFDLMCLVIAQANDSTYYEAIAELASAAKIDYHADWTPPPDRNANTTAHGYSLGSNGWEPFWEENFGSGWTTAIDLARWLDALLSGSIVSSESIRAMTTRVQLEDGRSWPYGLGLVVSEFLGRPILEHTGNVSGFTSVVRAYPEDELIVAVMTNLGMTTALPSIQSEIARDVLGAPAETIRDERLPADLRDRLVGTYDAGGLWFALTQVGAQLVLTMRDPGTEEPPSTYIKSALLYQGQGHFVGELDPEAIKVWVNAPGAPPDEIHVSIAGPGWRSQAMRR